MFRAIARLFPPQKKATTRHRVDAPHPPAAPNALTSLIAATTSLAATVEKINSALKVVAASTDQNTASISTLARLNEQAKSALDRRCDDLAKETASTSLMVVGINAELDRLVAAREALPAIAASLANTLKIIEGINSDAQVCDAPLGVHDGDIRPLAAAEGGVPPDAD